MRQHVKVERGAQLVVRRAYERAAIAGREVKVVVHPIADFKVWQQVVICFLIMDNDVLKRFGVVILVTQSQVQAPSLPLLAQRIIGRGPVVVAVASLDVAFLIHFAGITCVAPFYTRLVFPSTGGKVIFCSGRADFIVIVIVYRLRCQARAMDVLSIGLPGIGTVVDEQQSGVVGALPRVAGRNVLVV